MHPSRRAVRIRLYESVFVPRQRERGFKTKILIVRRMSRSYGTVSPCGKGRQFLGAKSLFSPAYVNFNLMEEQRVRSNFVGATFYMEKEDEMAAIPRVLFREAPLAD